MRYRCLQTMDRAELMAELHGMIGDTWNREGLLEFLATSEDDELRRWVACGRAQRVQEVIQ